MICLINSWSHSSAHQHSSRLHQAFMSINTPRDKNPLDYWRLPVPVYTCVFFGETSSFLKPSSLQTSAEFPGSSSSASEDDFSLSTLKFAILLTTKPSPVIENAHHAVGRPGRGVESTGWEHMLIKRTWNSLEKLFFKISSGVQSLPHLSFLHVNRGDM